MKVQARWLRVVAAVVGVAVGLAALSWYVALPHYRPPLRPGETYGVDVSHHQGRIDWDAVAADGIAFAYIKASEGGDFRDRQFADNWEAARTAGLDVGAYHFFTLCRPGDEQAEWFLDVASPTEAALPPAVDLELAGNCADRPEPAQVAREVDTFLTMVESAWQMPVLMYVGDDWESRYPTVNRMDRPQWHLRFLRRPSETRWDVWQIHGFAHVEGIEGRVDLDVRRPGLS